MPRVHFVPYLPSAQGPAGQVYTRDQIETLLATDSFSKSIVTGGSLVHGQSFDISGSGFGTNVTPVAYDDFSVGTIGNQIANTSAIIGTWESGAPAPPRYSTATSRGVHSRVAHCNFSAENGSGANALSSDVTCSEGQTAYVDWWMKYNYTPGFPEAAEFNFKILRWYGTPSTPEWNFVYLERGTPSVPRLLFIPVDPGNGDPTYESDVIFEDENNVWKHYQGIVQPKATISQDVTIFQVDCVTKFNQVGGQRASHDTYDGLRIGYYEHSPYFSVYLSSVLIQKSAKRVEVGDNETYGNCAVREIQPCSAGDWADTSIHIPKFNKGLLSSGTNYLHVSVNANFGTPLYTQAVQVA